jgi:hypothetical protein
MGQQQLFTINGLVDTNKTVWQNLEELAGASAAYVTWDPYTFKYGVVINQPGNSIRSFTDDNIIGAISITETPFDELYNSAEIRFPNKDIRDKTDTIRYDQPAADRFDLEPDNKLSIHFDFVNDPIQADVIARTELKQSRVSKTISFTTDFQQLDMAPGDIIDITNPYWGWDEKLFRIVEITQTDTVQGEIFVDIVAVEYDASVYNYNDLTRLERTVSTGVPAVKNNAAVQTRSDEDLGTQVGRAVATDQGAAGLAAAGYSTVQAIDYALTDTVWETYLNTMWGGIGSGPPGSDQTFDLVADVTGPAKLLRIHQAQPFARAWYIISTGTNTFVQESDNYIPLNWLLRFTPLTGTGEWIRAHDGVYGESDVIFEIVDPEPGEYKLSWNTGYSHNAIGIDTSNLVNNFGNDTFVLQEGQYPTYTETTYNVKETSTISLVKVENVLAPGVGTLASGTQGTWTLFLD